MVIQTGYDRSFALAVTRLTLLILSWQPTAAILLIINNTTIIL